MRIILSYIIKVWWKMVNVHVINLHVCWVKTFINSQPWPIFAAIERSCTDISLYTHPNIESADLEFRQQAEENAFGNLYTYEYLSCSDLYVIPWGDTNIRSCPTITLDTDGNEQIEGYRYNQPYSPCTG